MRTRGLVLLSIAMAVALPTGCTMGSQGKIPDPRFKRFSREHPMAVNPAPHRAGDLELTFLSGSVTEVYTAVGSEDWTAYVDTKLANLTDKPLRIDMNSMVAIRAGGGTATAVYFGAVDLPPRGQGPVRIAIPAGLTRFDQPLTILYQGMRMNLN